MRYAVGLKQIPYQDVLHLHEVHGWGGNIELMGTDPCGPATHMHLTAPTLGAARDLFRDYRSRINKLTDGTFIKTFSWDAQNLDHLSY